LLTSVLRWAVAGATDGDSPDESEDEDQDADGSAAVPAPIRQPHADNTTP
jgi:hypothetical protein